LPVAESRRSNLAPAMLVSDSQKYRNEREGETCCVEECDKEWLAKSVVGEDVLDSVSWISYINIED
jgi:hypothetical protein